MYVGLDAGTSVVKAVALDDDGGAIAVASRPTRTLTPAPGHQEQDLEAVIAAAAGAIREVVAAAGTQPDLIGLTGQGDGVWLLDAAGNAVRPPILWSDARAVAITEQLIDSGLAERLFRRNGNALFPGAAAPILSWLRTHEPDVLARAATAASCDGAIFQRLTGRRQTDPSDASLPFLDMRSWQYDEETIALCGMTDLRHLLPPVEPDRASLAPLTGVGAALTGLPAGLPVHAGPYDIPSTMIGAGITKPGQGLIILGTTLACGVLIDEYRTDGAVAGLTFCMPEPDRWGRVMAAMVGTPVLEWALTMVGADRTELDALLSASEPGANGVSALPFLSPAGERAPFLDPLARGELAGVSLESTRADIVRAVCEGIAHAARHCLEAAGHTGGEVMLCGGGARSPVWRQILADVLGRPLLLARPPEVGARGAVMAALAATGRPVDAGTWCRPEQTIQPRPECRETYDVNHRRYLRRLESARSLWAAPVIS